jgi:hypothetical protein
MNVKEKLEFLLKNPETTKRIAQCVTCEQFFKPTAQCKLCYCFVKIKAQLPSATCPIGRWK